jgi:ADP-ribosylglycohydrolase
MASLDRLTHLYQQPRPCFSGWDAPMGLIHAGNPAGAAESGYVMAVAIATALAPGATFEDVIENVIQYSWTLGGHQDEFIGRLNRALEIAEQCETPFEFYEPFYHELLVTFPPWEAVFTMEMIPAALGICKIVGNDGRQAIVGATNLGRDADTIVAITGEMIGALYGVDALPSDWVEKVLRLNPDPDMRQMAKDLSTLVIQRYQDQIVGRKKLISGWKI